MAELIREATALLICHEVLAVGLCRAILGDPIHGKAGIQRAGIIQFDGNANDVRHGMIGWLHLGRFCLVRLRCLGLILHTAIFRKGSGNNQSAKQSNDQHKAESPSVK